MISIFKLFFRYSFFIAICAVAMLYQSELILRKSISVFQYGFVFFVTLAAYNGYWWLSHIAEIKKSRTLLLVRLDYWLLSLLSFLMAGTFLFYGPVSIPMLILISGLTLLYHLHLLDCFRLKSIFFNFPLVKIFILSLVWSLSTVYLCVQMDDIQWSGFSFFLSRFCFIFMIAVLFEKKDDWESVNDLNYLRMMRYAFFVSSFALWLMFQEGYPLTQITVLGLMNVLVACCFFLSFRFGGFWFYYVLVDGLMLLNAFLTFLISN